MRGEGGEGRGGVCVYVCVYDCVRMRVMLGGVGWRTRCESGERVGGEKGGGGEEGGGEGGDGGDSLPSLSLSLCVESAATVSTLLQPGDGDTRSGEGRVTLIMTPALCGGGCDGGVAGWARGAAGEGGESGLAGVTECGDEACGCCCARGGGAAGAEGGVGLTMTVCAAAGRRGGEEGEAAVVTGSRGSVGVGWTVVCGTVAAARLARDSVSPTTEGAAGDTLSHTAGSVCVSVRGGGEGAASGARAGERRGELATDLRRLGAPKRLPRAILLFDRFPISIDGTEPER